MDDQQNVSPAPEEFVRYAADAIASKQPDWTIIESRVTKVLDEANKLSLYANSKWSAGWINLIFQMGENIAKLQQSHLRLKVWGLLEKFYHNNTHNEAAAHIYCQALLFINPVVSKTVSLEFSHTYPANPAFDRFLAYCRKEGSIKRLTFIPDNWHTWDSCLLR